MPCENGECGTEHEYSEEDGVTPAEENENGEETCQRQTPHDARRFGFGVPVRGIVLRVNVDALGVRVDNIPFRVHNLEYEDAHSKRKSSCLE
jgi:hypothetical protein